MDTTQTAPGHMKAVEHGVHEGIRWAVVEAPMYGALNGYVQVPQDHPWHALDYDAPELSGVVVHGGLTFADRSGWIGFDTLHSGDSWPGSPDYNRQSKWSRHWDKDQVVAEAKSLAGQVAAAAGSLGDVASREALDADARRVIDRAAEAAISRGVDRVAALASLARQAEAALDEVSR
ncbi:MAG: hypothetical protein IE923_04445 [Micrococcales bacterium]|nr:hypothetical protein [Micrococcales bacterium]